jgi:hypothetical protein
MIEDAGGGALLHDPALAHDNQLVGHRAHDLEVVADEEVGEIVAGLQVAQESTTRKPARGSFWPIPNATSVPL